MIFRLVHATARQRAQEAVKSAPDGYVVRISEPSRTLEQNDALHAILTDISKSWQWAGMWLTVEEWKRLMVAAWMRATGRNVRLVPALDGQGFDALYQRTSKLGKAEMSELLDFVQAWAAEREAA